jgi:type III pantothenate kinase
LASNAAQLFNVELHMPDAVIGRNTADQLRSGIVAGHLAMLEGMIERTRAELGTDAQVILTGGLAPLFADRSSLFDHFDPDLTLHGLRLIYDRVEGSRRDIATTAAETRRGSVGDSREDPDAA